MPSWIPLGLPRSTRSWTGDHSALAFWVGITIRKEYHFAECEQHPHPKRKRLASPYSHTAYMQQTGATHTRVAQGACEPTWPRSNPLVRQASAANDAPHSILHSSHSALHAQAKGLGVTCGASAHGSVTEVAPCTSEYRQCWMRLVTLHCC